MCHMYENRGITNENKENNCHTVNIPLQCIWKKKGSIVLLGLSYFTAQKLIQESHCTNHIYHHWFRAKDLWPFMKRKINAAAWIISLKRKKAVKLLWFHYSKMSWMMQRKPHFNLNQIYQNFLLFEKVFDPHQPDFLNSNEI